MVSESNNNAPISQKKKRYSPFFFIRSPVHEPEIESPITYRYQETKGEANFINTEGRDMSQLVEPGGPEPGKKHNSGGVQYYLEGVRPINIWTELNIKIGIVQKVYE